MSPAYVEPEWVGEMKRTREMLEMWDAKRAKEAPRTYKVHPEDQRAVPEPMAKAIKRHTIKRQVKRGR